MNYNLAEIEKATIIACLQKHPDRGMEYISKLLGISRKKLYLRTLQYNIDSYGNTIRTTQIREEAI